MAAKEKLLSPLSEKLTETTSLAPRLASLKGKVVCLLDIRKRQGDVFLDRLEERLRAWGELKEIVRKQKPGEERPAPEALRQELAASCDAVVIALAD